jgi:hypothetical protein
MSDNEITNFVDLKKMSAEINANNNSNNIMDIDSPNIDLGNLSAPPPMQVQSSPQKTRHQMDPRKKIMMQKQKKVMFQNDGENQCTHVSTDIQNDQLIVAPTQNDIDFFNIGSHNVPKQTLYLFFALLVVGALIWYFTCREKPENDEEKN